MVLTFAGGVTLPTRTDALKNSLILTDVPQVMLPLGDAEEAYTLTVCEGEEVPAGGLVATLGDGSPVYSSIPGRVTGVFEKDGMHYVSVERNREVADLSPVSVREPESKRLEELTAEELLSAIKALGIHDLWSGDLLWRRLTPLVGKIRRVVVDTTDDTGCSFTGYRTSLRHSGAILGGVKVLLHLLGASKAILAIDVTKPKIKEAFTTLINDPSLIVLAETEAKYPTREETLYQALYVRHLKRGGSAEEEGVLFIKPQTAAQLYTSLLTGKPHTTRTLTAFGEGFGKNAVVDLPLGTPWKTVLEAVQFKGGAYRTMVNSPLGGKQAEGAIDGKAEAVFASLPLTKKPSHCISCGRCADACPMRLMPYKSLTQRSYLSAKRLAAVCIGCGCCEYVCPAAIPLREHIARHKNP
ncbi:MAG: 4Fe-4S dicluster domain-containing protein [Clostridia bacterium]|nr:4Fe-4S dicluster domain-containing protein [Clostridia bacterium]